MNVFNIQQCSGPKKTEIKEKKKGISLSEVIVWIKVQMATFVLFNQSTGQIKQC